MIKCYKDYKQYVYDDLMSITKEKGLTFGEYMIGRFYKNDIVESYRYCKALRRLEYSQNVLRHHALGRLIYLVAKFAHHRMGVRYKVAIKPNVCASGLSISHITMGGAILNAKSIGKNFSVRQYTTIGKKNNECPVIGDGVVCGANVVIIGGVSIGDYAVVGAGSVVVKDIPSKAIVAGNPAKILGFREDI